jgi:hypothetical protein
MLRAPIKVYIKNQQGSGYLCIVHYGEKFDKANGGKRKPVRLLYNGSNQYVLSFPFFHLVRLGQLHRKAALRIADRRRLVPRGPGVWFHTATTSSSQCNRTKRARLATGWTR